MLLYRVLENLRIILRRRVHPHLMSVYMKGQIGKVAHTNANTYFTKPFRSCQEV